MPFAAIAMSISAAAKIELFTYLVCHAMEPVVNPDQGEAEPLAAIVVRSVMAAFVGESLAPACFARWCALNALFCRARPEGLLAGSCRRRGCCETDHVHDGHHGHPHLHDHRLVGCRKSFVFYNVSIDFLISA